MLAVYVHKDNPIAKTGLTPGAARRHLLEDPQERHADVTTWGDLGLTGEWANKPISMYGRNSASGTYGYFKKHALFEGDYKDTVKEQPGSSSVVQGVANDKFGIGYSGIGYKTADVAVVPLAPDMSSQPVPATAETVADYPLARFLYLYLNYRPGSRLDPLRGEYLKYIFSQEGQLAVLKDGYLPVTAKIAAEDLAKVNLRLGQ
jgi:phosphate transport system substrate-binding protein